MSSPAPRLTLGGDFEINNITLGNPDDLTKLTQGLKGTWTISGRSALSLQLASLLSRNIHHIQLPAYLCDSVIAPIEAKGLSYSFYEVDLDLVAHPPTGTADSAVLIIDYFGWQNPGLTHVREGTVVIEDRCQAMLSTWSYQPSAQHLLIASPRKFGPTGLGGWCDGLGADGSSKSADEMLIRSLNARVLKGNYLADATLPVNSEIENSYLTALSSVEEFLDKHPNEATLPEFGLKVIAGLDWSFVAQQRRTNWLQLIQILPNNVTPVFSSLPESVVPLGLVVRVANRDLVRKRLAANRIFCPVHWPLPREVDRHRFPMSAQLADTLLTLPIDQRYGESDMTRLSEALTRAVEATT
jgi:hypothetical protein